MTVLTSGFPIALLVASLAVSQAGPETFDIVASATFTGASGAVTVPMTIRIDRYTPEPARLKMTDALKHGGYPGFLQALRDTARAGELEVAGQKFVIRWAHQVPAEAGRTISIVTDSPVFFVGGGRAGAKSKTGYEIALVQLKMDGNGRGTGTMAAAARVKPGGDTGVQIDNYAETPLTLTATARAVR